MKAIIFSAMLGIAGCADESASDRPIDTNQTPTETPCTDTDTISKPGAGTIELDVYSLDVDSDKWSAKAEALWQDVTVNGVLFHHHPMEDRSECRPGVVTVQRIGLEEWPAYASSVGADPKGFGATIPRAGGCSDIRLVWPWPKDKEVVFTSKWDSLKENPLVLIVTHEIGHVLKLDHGSANERSIMIQYFEDLQVNRPTCLDVNRLGVLLGRPMVCKETF